MVLNVSEEPKTNVLSPNALILCLPRHFLDGQTTPKLSLKLLHATLFLTIEQYDSVCNSRAHQPAHAD